MISREHVYEMLTKEDAYAQGWGQGKQSVQPGFPAHTVSRQTGQPYSLMEWLTFVELYLNEAKTGYANYVPDMASIRIRLLKAASLLVTALQVHGDVGDLERLAGVSRTKFPINSRGLADLKDVGKAATDAT